jgi:hypothetical protein
MKLVTLGAPRLDGPDAIPSAARRKQLALLTYLARQENREATRSQLADLLWEDGDRARARHSLRQALSGLRPLLGDLLTTDGQHVRLSGALPLDLTDMELLPPDDTRSGSPPAEQEFLPGFDDVGGERWRSWLRRERDAVRRRFRWRSGPAANRASRAGAGRERRALEDALDGAWEDIAPGGALIVDAAPDATRTALCERFAAARVTDGQLLVAEAGATIVKPWGYLCRLCARLPELDGLADAPASALAALRRFTPGLSARFPRLPSRSTSSQDPAGALAETLGAAASRGPLTVLATDFERTDHASREVICQLVRERPTNVSFVLVGSLADPVAGPELWSLARLPGVRLIQQHGAPEAAPAVHAEPPEPVPPMHFTTSRFTQADRLLLASGGVVAAIVLILALLAAR